MNWPKELIDKILSGCVWEDGPLPTKCLIWKGSLSVGYGRFKYAGQLISTHRVMYEAINGRTNRFVLHSQVKEIKSRMDNGASDPELAKEYGVAHKTIYDIRHGKNWRKI